MNQRASERPSRAPVSAALVVFSIGLGAGAGRFIVRAIIHGVSPRLAYSAAIVVGLLVAIVAFWVCQFLVYAYLEGAA